MSHDLELAAKAAGELTPAVEEFARATGVFEPVRELTAWLAEIIHYRRASHKARLLMLAAEQIRESGLPTQAVSDRLLRAVLEEGSLEDDEAMQERWANLLAHEAVGDRVPPSLSAILSELEPAEASLLDRLVPHDGSRAIMRGPFNEFGILPSQLDNLVRLRLLRISGQDAPVDESHMTTSDGWTATRLPQDFKENPRASLIIVNTDLASELVLACRRPQGTPEPGRARSQAVAAAAVSQTTDGDTPP